MKVFYHKWILIACFLLAQAIFHSELYAVNCDPLKPTKAIHSEIQNKIKIKADILSKRLGSGEVMDEYKKVERDIRSEFPNADQILLNNELIYFTCTLIEGPEMSIEDKINYINNITREIKGDSLYSMRKRFEVGSIEEKRLVFEEAKVSGDKTIISMMIRSALQSDDPVVQGEAIQYIFSNIKLINGLWKKGGTAGSGSFGFRITEMEESITAMNFQGNFSGSVFHEKVRQEVAGGSIVGTSIPISNSNCSVSANFDGKRSFLGSMTCILWFGNLGGNYSVGIQIPLY